MTGTATIPVSDVYNILGYDGQTTRVYDKCTSTGKIRPASSSSSMTVYRSENSGATSVGTSGIELSGFGQWEYVYMNGAWYESEL